ncbi:MAG TPA: hypothetical protein VJM14_15875 [Burkholderiales bacterium]|nr:hypothetical protein [Burkholderiales bacterium]
MNRYTWLLAAVLAGAAVSPPGLAQAPGSYGVAIVQPANEETVHDNEGNVSVQVAVSPSLAPGDRVALLLDGRQVSQQPGTTLALSGVERGTHTLQAQVVGAGGATLAASQLVTFHMWQASRLFPSRKAH